MHRRIQEKVNRIVKMKDGNYRIRDMYIGMNNRKLVFGEKEETLGKMSFELLTMFLQAKDYKVDKDDLKKAFWPKSTSSTSSMTSAIGALNDKLKVMECKYSIITDKDNSKFYTLMLQKK